MNVRLDTIVCLEALQAKMSHAQLARSEISNEEKNLKIAVCVRLDITVRQNLRSTLLIVRRVIIVR